MKHNRYWISSLAMLAMMLWLAGNSVIAAQHEQIMTVGKKGEVSFDTETKIGDLTFEPGRYRLQHRVDGSEHYVHFEPLMGTSHKNRSGDLKCTLETLSTKASRTELYTSKEDGARRVTKVVVKGENVAHVFSSSPKSPTGE